MGRVDTAWFGAVASFMMAQLNVSDTKESDGIVRRERANNLVRWDDLSPHVSFFYSSPIGAGLLELVKPRLKRGPKRGPSFSGSR